MARGRYEPEANETGEYDPLGPIDLDFAPTSFVADWSVATSIVQNIIGEARRETVFRRLREGGTAPLDARLLADHLTDELRTAVVAADPVRHSSGEFLPPYLPGEMEVARLLLATTPRLVYSVRVGEHTPSAEFRRKAWISRTTVYRVRVVDDHGSQLLVGDQPYRCLTLRLRDLVTSLDSVWHNALPDLPRWVPFPERLVLWRAEQGVPAAALAAFVQVYSVVYPDLERHYTARIQKWVARNFTPDGRLTNPLLACVRSLAEGMPHLWRRHMRRWS
jgi:hypothetical protein